MRTPLAPPSRRPIKVAYLIGELGYGGSERQLQLLVTHLDPERFACSIIVFNPSPFGTLDQICETAGASVIRMHWGSLSIAGRCRQLRHVLCRLAPDIVHSWTIHDNPYAGLVGLSAGIPIRWGAVRGSLALPGFQSLSPLMRWLSLHSVSKLTTNSPAIADELTGAGVGARHILMLPNGVVIDEPRVAADLSELGVSESSRVVGIVANLRRVKNLNMFVEAMARVISRNADVVGLVVGQPVPSEPEVLASLTTRIHDLGMDGRILFAGFRQDVPALLRRLSVLCLTSTSEGTPNSVLEGMAAGLPVVATRVGGVPNVIADGRTGILVNVGDADGLAGAITRLLEDPGLAQAMGASAKRSADDRFSASRASAELAAAYEAAIGGS